MEKIIAERYELNTKGDVIAKVDISPSVKKGMLAGGAKGVVVIKGQTFDLEAIKEILATKPVATKPVATKPVATKPVTTKPVATKPAAAKPVKEPRQPKGEGYSTTKGINFDKNTGRYQMRYILEGKQIYIATLDSEEEAIEAQKKLGSLFKRHYEAKRPEFDTDVELLKALYIQYLKPKKAKAEKEVTKPAAKVAKPVAKVAAKPVAKKSSKKEVDEL